MYVSRNDGGPLGIYLVVGWGPTASSRGATAPPRHVKFFASTLKVKQTASGLKRDVALGCAAAAVI